MDQESVEAFLEGLYAAAIETDGWARVGERLAELIEGRTSGLILMLAGQAATLLSTSGFPEGAERLYSEYFHQVDPWQKLATDQPKFRPIIGAEVVPEREFRRSEYYADFASRIGLGHMLGAIVPLGPSETDALAITVHRPYDAQPFGEKESRRLTQLLPHIQRAGQLYLRVRDLEFRAQTGFAALEALPYGVVVASRTGEVLFANAAAERLARHGGGLVLGKRGCGLGAANPREARTLRGLVHDAAGGGAGGTLRLTRFSDGAAFAVLVSPLRLPYRDAMLRQVEAALVIVKDLAEEEPPAVSCLKTLWGLTEAEARVALALFAGRDAEEIAVQRGVSITTVRTQIRQILAKTGASNLRDLARRLAGLPGTSK
ncbi:helix-turn-helix transcriptional regulator [Methylomagnum sp.]